MDGGFVDIWSINLHRVLSRHRISSSASISHTSATRPGFIDFPSRVYLPDRRVGMGRMAVWFILLPSEAAGQGRGDPSEAQPRRSPRVNVHVCVLDVHRWVMLVSDDVEETDVKARAFIIPYALREATWRNLVVIVWGLMMLCDLWPRHFGEGCTTRSDFVWNQPLKHLMLPGFHTSTVGTLKMKRGQLWCAFYVV